MHMYHLPVCLHHFIICFCPPLCSGGDGPRAPPPRLRGCSPLPRRPAEGPGGEARRHRHHYSVRQVVQCTLRHHLSFSTPVPCCGLGHLCTHLGRPRVASGMQWRMPTRHGYFDQREQALAVPHSAKLLRDGSDTRRRGDDLPLCLRGQSAEEEGAIRAG